MILNVLKTCPAIWKILVIVLIEFCNVNGIFQQILVPEPPPIFLEISLLFQWLHNTVKDYADTKMPEYLPDRVNGTYTDALAFLHISQ